MYIYLCFLCSNVSPWLEPLSDIPLRLACSCCFFWFFSRARSLALPPAKKQKIKCQSTHLTSTGRDVFRMPIKPVLETSDLTKTQHGIIRYSLAISIRDWWLWLVLTLQSTEKVMSAIQKASKANAVTLPRRVHP